MTAKTKVKIRPEHTWPNYRGGVEDMSKAAVHEAGHVVVGLALGKPFTRVRIDGESGRVEYPPPDPGPYEVGLKVVNSDLCLGPPLDPEDPFRREWEPRWATEMVITAGGCVAEQLAWELCSFQGFLPEADLAEQNEEIERQWTSNRSGPLWRTNFSFLLEYRRDLMGERGTDSDKIALFGTALDHLTGRGLMDWTVWAEQEASRILIWEWSAVERLAWSLDCRKSQRMTSRQVLRLLNEKPVERATLTSPDGEPLVAFPDATLAECGAG